jgi:D-alanine-D-alanine ligase
MYPKLWEACGLPYQKLLDELIELSLMHRRAKERMVTHYHN